MERDFRYLRDKYGEAGAREIFEKTCVQLLQKNYENAYSVKISQGNDVIDISLKILTKRLIYTNVNILSKD